VGGSGRLAVGLALASKLRGQSTVVVAFADDRDLESGRIWESCRIAARWTLPVVFVAEGRIEGALVDPGLRLVPVDGSRLANVYAATMDAVGLARAGEGPTIVVVTPPLDPLAALHEETQTTSVVEADWQSAVESGRGQAEAALATRDQNGQSAEDAR
jgi:hypothetical protein